MMSYSCLAAVEAQGMLHPNMPQWDIDGFELKLLEKQSMKKQTNKKIQHIKRLLNIINLFLFRHHRQVTKTSDPPRSADLAQTTKYATSTCQGES